MKNCVWSVQQWNCDKLSAIMPAVSFLVTKFTCLFKNNELWLGVQQWRILIPERTISFKKCTQDLGRRTIWAHLHWKVLYKLRRPWEYDIKTDLKQIWEGVEEWTGFICLRQDPVVGSSEHEKRSLDSSRYSENVTYQYAGN